MGIKNVEFINCYGRGFTADSMVLKDYLSNNKDCEYQFFSSHERGNKNPLIKTGLRNGRRVFCKYISNVICTDASVPLKLKPEVENSKRILMSIPYDYQFKLACLMHKNRRIKTKKTFSNFTHVLPGSKFGVELLGKAYEINGEVVDKVCFPYTYSLTNEKICSEVKKSIEFHFPESKDKKIISVITTHPLLIKESRQIIDLKRFLDSIDDNYFVFTNCMSILDESSKVTKNYSKCYGYIKNLIPAEDLLYVSDYLITNIGRYATAFCATGKPIACIGYENNFFEKYIKMAFPDLFIENIDRTSMEKSFNCREKQRRFKEYFSYDISSENPCKVIKDIISN